MLPERVAGRFRIVEEIGRGGMGVVYLAREDGRDEPVALKVLLSRRFSESALRHFEQEFRVLTSLSHPNLTEVYDFGRVTVEDGARQVPFFTMEFVDGKTLDRHIEPAGREFDRLYRSLAQVGQALAYLHGRGLVHQDVKPSNILVLQTEDGASTVKLMDLGLAGPPAEGAGPGSIRGTVAYLAPEAARGGLVDPRSDLYGLGCVAYQMVTGRVPFQGTSALGVLRGHLEEEPLSPRTLNDKVPPALEQLILSLLAKDPGLRPATADRFLEMLNEVAGGTLSIETPEVRRHRVLGAGFVGRESELQRLRALVEEARTGAGKLALVVGEAGVGKSKLLREFQVRCQLDGLDVFVGRAAAEEGSAGALAEALARAIRARGPLSEETVRRHGAVLESFLGPIDSVEVPDGRHGPPAAEQRFSLLTAVAEVLEDIARDGPVVLALDDLHAADEVSCALLGHLARHLYTPSEDDSSSRRLPAVLVVGAYRADEVSRSSPLFDLLSEGREDRLVEELFLGPLGPDETSLMLRAMLGSGSIPPLFLQRILEETRGNPLYLSELIGVLAEEGHLEPASGEPPDPDVLSRAEIPRKIRDLLERRLSRLEPEPLSILRAAQVLGGASIDPDAVAAITGMKWERVVRLLLDLLPPGLVHREADETGTPVYRMSHPALATLAADATPEDEARRLHSRAVSYLDRRGVPRRHAAWGAFARHAEAAALPGRAIEAYGRAGDLAQRLHAHREAIELYGRAIELVLRQEDGSASVLCGLYARRGNSHARTGDLQRAEEDYRWMLARAEKAGDDALRARAHLSLGDILETGSRYAEAEESLELAREIAERLRDDELSVRAQIGLGRVATKLGRFEEAIDTLQAAEEAATHSGLGDLRVEALLAAGTLHREQGNYRLSLESLQRADELTSSSSSPEVEEAIEQGSALALEVQGKHREAIEAYVRARDRARARGDIRATAALGTRLGAAFTNVGDYERAAEELEDALAAHRRLGSREGIILGLQSLARLHTYRGRFESALESAEDAFRQANKLGKKDLIATTLNLIGRIHLRLGDLEGAGSRLEEAQRIVRELGAMRSLAVFLVDVGDLRRVEGNSDDARRLYQESAFLSRKVGDRRLESVGMSRLGEAHLLDNNYDRARVACRKALSLLEGSGLPREEADARVLRARIELARPGGDVVRAEIDAREALTRYRSLREPEQIWQAEHLVARAAARLGRADEAASRIERAHRYLERLRSRLGERWKKTFLNDPGRRELYEDRERLGARVPREPATVENGAGAGGDYARLQEEAASLRRLLEINRTLNSTRKPQELLRLILDAALELTGAERGFLLLQDGEELATREARGSGMSRLRGKDLELSRSIAQKTIDSGEPLLSTDAEADDRLSGMESVHDLQIRSVLAVPLRIKNDVAGAIYLDHRLDRRLFTPAHLELASRLADQAALALDNARLVQETEEQRLRVERLNRELQRTVQTQRSELASVREELSFTRSSYELRYRFDDLVGGSPAMQRVYHLIERVAPKKLPVLITGESGTGKELIARALHAKSDRSGGSFFSVNCAALTETLLESELFGFKKGAFTGADRDKPGYFELANGGTLFLDEIGDMGEAMQAKLLRAIERGEVLPVGGKSASSVDVRIVSATNQDLQEAIRQKRFREDLFYRINVARIEVPPLRERAEDIPLLVDHFLTLLAKEEGQPKREIEPAALERLSAHDWPGNVRELQHQIQRAATFSKGTTVTLRDLVRYGDLPPPGRGAGRAGRAGEAGTEPEVQSLEELERQQIVLALERAGGNKTRAAELLGINRATLFRKLKKLGL